MSRGTGIKNLRQQTVQWAWMSLSLCRMCGKWLRFCGNEKYAGLKLPKLHMPNLTFLRAPTERNNDCLAILTGTQREAIPTPTPDRNLPMHRDTADLPIPIVSHPAVNGRAVIIKANFRPTKSITCPPHIPPIIAPILRRDWWQRGKQCN